MQRTQNHGNRRSALKENTAKKNVWLRSSTTSRRHATLKRSAVTPELSPPPPPPPRKRKYGEQDKIPESQESWSSEEGVSNAELQAELKAVIERARSKAFEQKISELQEAEEELKNRLSAIEQGDSQALRRARDVAETLFSPLAQAELELVDVDGNPFRSTLGERLADFKSTMRAQQDKCQRLWAEWEEVQREIVTFGQTILGKEAFEDVDDRGDGGGDGQDSEELSEMVKFGGLRALSSSSEAEVNDEKNAWKTSISELLSAAVQAAIRTNKKARDATRPPPKVRMGPTDMDRMLSKIY